MDGREGGRLSVVRSLGRSLGRSVGDVLKGPGSVRARGQTKRHDGRTSAIGSALEATCTDGGLMWLGSPDN